MRMLQIYCDYHDNHEAPANISLASKRGEKKTLMFFSFSYVWTWNKLLNKFFDWFAYFCVFLCY